MIAESGAESRRAGHDEPDYERDLVKSIRRIMRAFDVQSRALMAAHQITGPQLLCLIEILDQRDTTAKDLADEVHLSPSTLVGILDRLEGKELIERARDTEDRRRVRIRATDAGKQVAQEAPAPFEAGVHRALGRLPRSEQAAITRNLERLADVLEASDGGDGKDPNGGS